MLQLQEFLDLYSMKPVDRWKYGTLKFQSVSIPRSMIALLCPLLHCDEASSLCDDDDDNMDTSPGHTRNTQNKFSSAYIGGCNFFSHTEAFSMRLHHGITDHDHDICTENDKVCFLSALARCSKKLEINDCSDIVSGLLSVPEIDHLEAESLMLEKGKSLTQLEYARLDTLIRNSAKLKQLSLRLTLDEDVPQSFCDGFANYIRIQSLCMQTTYSQQYPFLHNMLVNKHCNGALERLLRNPQNQLKTLILNSTSLQDYHVTVIAQLLPTSHVQKIDLSKNNIQALGLLEFARQLPKMHSLTEIYLAYNPWEDSSLAVREACGAALLHGVIQNPSIRSMDCTDKFPQYPLLWYYLCLNRAGRAILTSCQDQPIPDGLWSRILSRAGLPSISPRDNNWKRKYNGPANAVYFFLQNCPKILSWQSKK